MKSKSLATPGEICDFFGIQPLKWGTIKVTRKCNLKCSHCYVSSAGKCQVAEELETAQIIKTIDEFKAHGCTSLFLNGGEPYLREDIFELYLHAHKNGFQISTSSNGYHFTPTMMKRLAALHPHLFQVSIDGFEKTHDGIRGIDGSYRKALDTLRLAREFLPRKTNIVMASTVMAMNCGDIPGLLDIARQLKVNTYCLIPLMPSTKTLNATDISVADKNDLFNALISLYSERYPKNLDLSLIVPPGIIRGEFKRSKYGMGYRCRFPYMLGIDSNGDVSPCEGFLEHPGFRLGNINDGGLKKALAHPVMQDILRVETRGLSGVCGLCKYAETCHGGCRVSAYERSKDLNGSDPLCQDFYDAGLFPKENLS